MLGEYGLAAAGIVLVIAWSALAWMVRRTERDKPPRRQISGYLLFGPLWLLIAGDAARPMTRRELAGWCFVIVLVIAAGIFAWRGY